MCKSPMHKRVRIGPIVKGHPNVPVPNALLQSCTLRELQTIFFAPAKTFACFFYNINIHLEGKAIWKNDSQNIPSSLQVYSTATGSIICKDSPDNDTDMPTSKPNDYASLHLKSNPGQNIRPLRLMSISKMPSSQAAQSLLPSWLMAKPAVLAPTSPANLATRPAPGLACRRISAS